MIDNYQWEERICFLNFIMSDVLGTIVEIFNLNAGSTFFSRFLLTLFTLQSVEMSVNTNKSYKKAQGV